MRALSLPLFVALAAAGCGKAPAPAEKAYTLFWTAQKTPAGGIAAKLSVPGGWTEELDAMGSPSFKVPGIDSPLPAVSLVALPCPDEGDCLEKIVSLQWNAEDLPATNREELAPGRLFITEDRKLEAAGGRRRVHARLFALHPAPPSGVMCVIRVMDAAGDKLPELRKVCESLTL